MKRYYTYSKCVKCGHTGPSAHYDAKGPVIHRTCHWCHFEWDELPLDHGAAKPNMYQLLAEAAARARERAYEKCAAFAEQFKGAQPLADKFREWKEAGT